MTDYIYFLNRLNDTNDDGTPTFSIKQVFTFLEKTFSALIVKIDVDDISSAFTLFESINNRGMPLTVIDLIKNSIIGKIGTNPEQTNRDWQKIVLNIEHFKDQERFLRHYYHAFQYDSNIKISGFTKATKSNIIKIYSKHIDKNVNFIFTELIDKSYIYNILLEPNIIDSTNKFEKYKQKLIDLKRLGIAPSYSLLLHLFVKYDQCDLSDILNFIENWFIRRHITDYPATNKLDQIFLDLCNNVYDDCDITSIKKYLKDNKRYMSDAEFENFLLNVGIYEMNTGATRCLLTKLEKSKRTKESTVDFWEVDSNNKLVWTIEHILPQNPSKNSKWIEIDETQREGVLHKLGNLTLTCYNSKLLNSDFSNKISIKDSNGLDIGLASGNVQINDYLKEKKSWEVEDINHRGLVLTRDILQLLEDKNVSKI